ncbi:probable E3 ubiquitin-protein ligase XERICO [Syzygium oleosum]|uniref:probable E3 ubiquitin-protein ligase XERICO n=1 Tax=Syzygium oleosum TaxID=219896 RepID=UPI0024BB10CA|nr:probable E3 ubiquitin-protein ligase XERICO [Syzygium oleosum]
MGISSYPGPPDGLLAMLVMSIVYVVAMLLNMAASLAPEDGEDSRPPAGERSRASAVRVRRFESRRRRGGSRAAAAEECCVCLSGFEDEEEVSEVERCKHVFHKGCLERWFQGYRFTSQYILLHIPSFRLGRRRRIPRGSPGSATMSFGCRLDGSQCNAKSIHEIKETKRI